MRSRGTSVAIVVALLLVVGACASEPPATTGTTPRTGQGGAEEALTAEGLGKVGTTVLKEVAVGVLQGIGTGIFTWVLGLVDPDPTPEKLKEIGDGVDRLEKDVAKLSADVQSMRTSMDQDFKDEQGNIIDTSVAPDRRVIDDAVTELNKFTTDTKAALANKSPLPNPNKYFDQMGNPQSLSALYNVLDHDLHIALTEGGSNTGGGSLISAADTKFAGLQAAEDAAKTGMVFDDRPLWQRLNLQEGATPEEITKACDELRTKQPASTVCAVPGPNGGAVPSVLYYDRMQTFINYYINYQVNGLQALTTALYAWDDGGKCPKPAQGDCAIAQTTAQDITAKVVNNVRQQLAMVGAPVSTADRVLERASGDTATLWRTSTTSATYSQTSRPTPPNGGTEWWVPIDCSLSGAVNQTSRPELGIPCSVKDTPYTVTVPSQRAEDQICVGAPEVGKEVAAKQPHASENGVFDALPSEWASCARPEAFANGPATGLRVPTHSEMASAVAKHPENSILNLGTEPSFGAAPYLSHTPAEVTCGWGIDDDKHNPFFGAKWKTTPVNAAFDRWIGGWATTWSKAAGWSENRQFTWSTPRVFTFDTNSFEAAAGYAADGPCERRSGAFDGDGKGDLLISYGWSQCVVNDTVYHDWCYGHRNYVGNQLPATGAELRVWGAYTLVTCPGQRTDSGTGERTPAWQINDCAPGTHPTGKDWELPGCKTPAGQWTQCGSAWVDALLPVPVIPARLSTTTTSTPGITAQLSTTTTSAPTTTTPGITAKLSTTTTTVPTTTTPGITAKLSTTTTTAPPPNP